MKANRSRMVTFRWMQMAGAVRLGSSIESSVHAMPAIPGRVRKFRASRIPFCIVLLIGALLGGTARAATYTWTKTTSGTYNWDNASSQDNWGTGAAFPTAVGDVADLTNGKGGTINLNQPITVGQIRYGNASATVYTFNIEKGSSGLGSLIMDVTGTGTAKIDLTTNQKAYFYFNVDIQLKDNLSAIIYGYGTHFNGIISGDGMTLTKSGTGGLTLAGANTYSGATTVSAGVLTLANGGSLLMDINDGSGTQITRTGGTLNLNGRLNLDVDDFTGSRSTRNLVVGGATYHSTTFSISMNGGPVFTEKDNVWTYKDSKGLWTFTEATGELNFTPPAGTVIIIH